MNWVEALVLSLAIAFVVAIFAIQFYLKRKGRPSLGSDCDCGGKGRTLIKKYEAAKKKGEKKDCPSCHKPQ